MNYFKFFSLVLFSNLLLGCSHNEIEALPTIMPKNLWTCDTGAIIEWQAEDRAINKIQLRLDGGGKLHILNKVRTTSKGTLYSNGEIAIRIKDSSGIIFLAKNDEIIGQNCKAN